MGESIGSGVSDRWQLLREGDHFANPFLELFSESLAGFTRCMEKR
jgi:hypothetical protein